MPYFRPTILFCIGVVLVGTAYDLWAVAHNYDWTISANLTQAAHDFPALTFLSGFLTGHVVWQHKAKGAPPT